VEILSRLITAHRRLYGAHKDQDVLQEVADLDPTKVGGPARETVQMIDHRQPQCQLCPKDGCTCSMYMCSCSP
jgi:hypothetical protein